MVIKSSIRVASFQGFPLGYRGKPGNRAFLTKTYKVSVACGVKGDSTVVGINFIRLRKCVQLVSVYSKVISHQDLQ